jgi:DNA processing protein
VTFDRKLLLLALSRAAFLRPRERYRLARRWLDVRNLETTSLADIRDLLGRGVRDGSWQPATWTSQAWDDLEAIEAGRLHACFVGEGDYPRLLELKLADPPVVLFWRGTVPAWSRPMVAVVGTRRPTGRGRIAAVQTGKELAELRVPVISGLARGIDRNAHQGCLEGGGTAIAVLGSGIDRVYPTSNLVLARQILEARGCLLSEYPPGVGVFKHHFPARNRIISGLSHTVVVIQAPARSGALITADYALEQGVDLVVHTAGLRGPEGAGTRELADAGAPAIRTASELLAQPIAGDATERQTVGVAGGDAG